ncbi:hypothetical protein G7067_00350 [Leucobacter insecticola]|uniref:Large exoprotein n=1 Tax=Leucobacter insecticola TaxID=2714934 RepID=A0A6G8FG40_9MICO|nr:hypothetical protein [Leucobacter insecticola]QIM15213.1 hypothetical protein G7067_00350 [Leucobacter insecticola]
MTGGGLGGGVIFVVAALLWGAVLVPAWVRRREFRAAERNALRLQRTLRVLAETSEVPHEVRLEATARQALAQEKLLRTAQRRQEAERDAELAEARAAQLRAEIRAQQLRRKQATVQRAARLRRPVIRRVRGIASLAALVGLLGVLVGAGFAIAGSGAAVLLGSVAVFAAGLGGLVLLAPGRVRAPSIAAEYVEDPVPVLEFPEPEITATGETEATSAAHHAAQRAAAERIERAKALSRARAQSTRAVARENQPDSMLLREARAAASVDAAAVGAGPVAPAANVAPAPPTVSAAEIARQHAATRAKAQEQTARELLSRMGVVGDTSEGMPDLDAVLRRRRSG